MREPKIEVCSKPTEGHLKVMFAFSEKGKPVFENSSGQFTVPPLPKGSGFGGKLGESLYVPGALLVGLGEKGKLLPRSVRIVPQVVLGAASFLRSKGVSIDCSVIGPIHAKNLAYAFAVKVHKSGQFKSKKDDDEDKQELERVELICQKGDAAAAAKDGLVMASHINYARDLCNTPANIATPKYMAAKAHELAKSRGLVYKELSKEDMKKQGMNALLAVSAGSAQEPILPILEYRHKNAKRTVVVVGKGITFDSGGISLKPSRDMDHMKFDKSGACAVLGIMSAVAQLKPHVNVIGLLPCTENMPDGRASKPGDIVKAYNGKTIEILNTDAEGRLILADAIAYAEEKYKPDYIIDLATLTGACVVALGSYASGLMANDESLEKLLRNASENGFDEVWPLPMWDEYAELVKGKFADLRNVTNLGEAGTITAACFIKSFVSKAKWAHVDIAGTAYRTRAIPPVENGATGAGVSLVVEAIRLLEKEK